MTIDKANLQRKAATLIEALPFLRKYNGKIFVIKFGGNAMINDELAAQFAQDVVLLKKVGINPVIVHGGGPQIGEMLDKLGIESHFEDGLRVTSKETMEVAEMVLSGTLNKSIVAAINAAGGNAVGLSGKDNQMVIAEKKLSDSGADLGFVGSPKKVDASGLKHFVEKDMIPVIAPIAAGECGETFNINGDTMAGAVAAALGARRFLLLTDVAGVLNTDGEMLTDLNEADISALIKDGTIKGGMLPKVATCLEATQNGATAAVILDGREAHAILLELFTEHGAGTLIRSDDA